MQNRFCRTVCVLSAWLVISLPLRAENPAVVPHRGWEGALRASNEALEIVVVPQTGRVVHLSIPGGENLLTFEESLAGKRPPEEEGDWLNYGGDWLWPVHQDSWEKMGGVRWPPLRVLDRGMWFSESEVDEKGTIHIRLRKDVGDPVFVRMERHVELPPGQVAEVKIHQSIRRIQASDIPVCLWQVSQVEDADGVFLGADKSDFDGGGFRHIDFELPGEDLLKWCGETLTFKAGERSETKLGAAGNWIAARRKNQALLIWAEGGVGSGTLPDGGCSVVTYSNRGLGYSEIETQSDEVDLAPGEVLTNTLTYRIVKTDADEDLCETAGRLAPLPPARKRIRFLPASAHPGEVIEVRVKNPPAGSVLHWGVNSPEGNWQLPDPVYRPEGSELSANGKALETPLPPAENGVSLLRLGPFNRPEQVVNSLHAVLRAGEEWDSNQGENYNLTLEVHPDASAIKWGTVSMSRETGEVGLMISTQPPADDLQLYVDAEKISGTSGALLQTVLDAREWEYGPRRVTVRAQRNGHLSTATRQIWKLPKIQTVPDPDPELPYGVSQAETGRWRVLLYAPHAKFMELEWRKGKGAPQRDLMGKSENGHWVYELPEDLQAPFAYRFLVNGDAAFADPWSRDVLWRTPDGRPSHLPEHAWSLAGSLPEPLGAWDRPDPSTWVIYELHIPDVAPGEGFTGLRKKLGYIASLGVNAIEPLPVTAFPGEESWGYNPAFHMAVERSYGTPEEFKELIRAAREKGIAYVADLVLNHVDGGAPLNRLPGEPEFNPYTMPFDQFNWGFPKLDQQNPALKRYVKDTLEQWVNQWGVDGFRYDATQWVKWSGYKDWGASWMAYVVEQANPDVIQIAENLPSEPAMVKGTELDAEWDGHYRWRMRKVFTEARIEEPEKMREILDPRSHGYLNGWQRVPYIESHDEERFVRELLHKGYSARDAFTRHHAAAAITLTVPGMPMLYAGQEWGEMTKKVVGNNPLQWQLKAQPARAELVKKFTELIHLRVSHRALHHDRLDLLHLDAENGTVAYLRPGIPESVLVAFNVSEKGALLNLEVNGSVEAEIHQPDNPGDLKKLTLRPGQARVFRIRHQPEVR